jgi:hypothetical protein
MSLNQPLLLSSALVYQVLLNTNDLSIQTSDPLVQQLLTGQCAHRLCAEPMMFASRVCEVRCERSQRSRTEPLFP